MGVLEQVMELKRTGIPENEIIGKLREQGVSPNAITEALNQAKIKSAVSSSGGGIKNEMEPSMMGPEGAEPPPKELPTEGGISDVELTPPPPQYQIAQPKKEFAAVSRDISDEEEYVPQPQGEFYPNQDQQQYQQDQYQPEQYIPQGYAPQQEYGYPTSGISDTDTIIEITEQVFSEKIKTIQKQVEDLTEFKVLAQTKIDNISDRLKRIELNIDRLQAEILEKVGSYGRGLEGIKKEMGMMQQSFGKIVSTVVDKTKEKHKRHIPSIAHTPHYRTHITKKKTSKPVTKKISKKK
jgi:hypothetical protein